MHSKAKILYFLVSGKFWKLRVPACRLTAQTSSDAQTSYENWGKKKLLKSNLLKSLCRL